MALTKARLILALHDAFQCGIEQGQDEATSYDWGSPPRISREEAFKELFERWETGYSGKDHIRKALLRGK